MFRKANQKKRVMPKIVDTSKYYRMFADFQYLKDYNYKIVTEIGRGGYGLVYKAENLEERDSSCAIKIPFATMMRQLTAVQAIILMLARNKEHIAYIRKIIQAKQIFHIVMDYQYFHPFASFFHNTTLTQASHYIYELLLGLKQLKQLGIYHRDIKPANFLYNRQRKRGKIVDFGLAQIDHQFVNNLQKQAKSLRQNQDIQCVQKQALLQHYKRLQQYLEVVGTNKIGTQAFMPIQSLLKLPDQSYSSDIWSVGVIFLQFASRRYSIFPPVNYPLIGVQDQKQRQLVNYILQLAVIFGKSAVIQYLKKIDYFCQLPSSLEEINLRQICIIDGFDDTAYDLMKKLLDIDYKTRISVQDALQHQLFDSIRHMHDDAQYQHDHKTNYNTRK